MSHEAHSHDTHSAEKQHKAPLGQAFWFVLILAGLFIAALNFVNVMGGESAEGHGGHGAATHEAATGGHEAAGHEATTHEEAAPAGEHAEEHAATDSAAHSEAHH